MRLTKPANWIPSFLEIIKVYGFPQECNNFGYFLPGRRKILQEMRKNSAEFVDSEVKIRWLRVFFGRK